MKKHLTAAFKGSYLKAIIQSFYSPEIYRDAIVRWKGFGGRYLMVLGALLAIILAAGFYINLAQYSREDLPYLIKQLPEITFEDGIISTKAKQPVIIQNRDKSFTTIIDTTKAASDFRDMKTQLAIGKNFIVVRNPDQSYQVIDLRKIKNKVIINEQTIYEAIPMFKIIVLPVLWIGQMLNLILKLLLVTVLSYIVTAFMREEYEFTTRMRLGILAMTPGILISLGITLVMDHEVAPWFSMLLACLYIYVMIVLMRRLPPVETNNYSEII